MVNSYIPETYKQALRILADNNLTILAGGTDLMVKTRKWSGLAPGFKGDVLFVSQLKELDFIRREDGKIYIGATTTLEKLLHDKNTPELLKMAITQMASPGIRHTATLAGNIGNASPAGDSLPVLYILNAKIVLESIETERILSIEEFILGPGSKNMINQEMIREIIIDDVEFDFVMYEKAGGRKSDAISKVSFAGAFTFSFGMVHDMRIAFGAVGPTIIRIKEYESRFKETPIWDLVRMSDNIKDLYNPGIQPINDQRSTAEYRKTCALNILGKFLSEAEISAKKGDKH